MRWWGRLKPYLIQNNSRMAGMQKLWAWALVPACAISPATARVLIPEPPGGIPTTLWGEQFVNGVSPGYICY